MTENKRFYIDFVALTTKQYEHCTLEEKLAVYVQHRPACVVPFLKELVDEVGRLEEELDEHRSEIINLKDFLEACEKDD